MALQARIRAAESRISYIKRMRHFQLVFLCVYLEVHPDFFDNTVRPCILRAIELLEHNAIEVFILWAVLSLAIAMLPLAWAVMLLALRPFFRFCRKTLGPRFRPRARCYRRFIREAMYLYTVPLLAFLGTWIAGDQTLVMALLFSVWLLGNCETGGSFVDDEPTFLRWYNDMGLGFCNACGQMDDDLEDRVWAWAFAWTDYDFEAATFSTAARKQGFCEKCADSYKKQV